MLGEKTRRRQLRKLLDLLGYRNEKVLGWDTGTALITAQGQAAEMKALLVATPVHVFLIDERTPSRAMAMSWDIITDTETRQDTWKTSFVMYTADGGSVTLRTGAPRPVQTLIADRVKAGAPEPLAAGSPATEQGYFSLDDREATARQLKLQWEAGELDPPPSFKVTDPDLDLYQLPAGPVSAWEACPACAGKLLLHEGIGDCSDCRRIWCDPKVAPVLDEESGALVGRTDRIPMSPTDYETGSWKNPIAYRRWPSRDGIPWPLPGDRNLTRSAFGGTSDAPKALDQERFPSAPGDLPYLIERLGLADELQLREAWKEHLFTGRPFLESLVVKGFTDKDELESALREHVHCRRCAEPAKRAVGLCDECLSGSASGGH